jgi:hypothetical protein
VYHRTEPTMCSRWLVKIISVWSLMILSRLWMYSMGLRTFSPRMVKTLGNCGKLGPRVSPVKIFESL